MQNDFVQTQLIVAHAKGCSVFDTPALLTCWSIAHSQVISIF